VTEAIKKLATAKKAHMTFYSIPSSDAHPKGKLAHVVAGNVVDSVADSEDIEAFVNK